MAITPSWSSSTEATEVEQEYIDKGAVKTPQVNPMVEAKFRKGIAEAEEADFVEWPTKISADDTGY